MLDSQAGPHAASVFTTPVSPELSLSSQLFRVLLPRRLRLPLPFDFCAGSCMTRPELGLPSTSGFVISMIDVARRRSGVLTDLQ